MPPVRTMPSAKPVKTERTHEENQERAYVAASRRSDRSLEARVESARRASEIHKKRTGRSLRVTEQDVINEEMYEEEDDDLPIQYRRLASHLQTGSASFDRRLAAYLTNHVAMRDALESSIQQSYQQQQLQKTAQPGGGPSSYQSSMVSPQQQQQQMFLQQQARSQSVSQNMQQQSMQRAIYRQAPYPTPQPTGNHSFRPTPQHQRSASIAITNEFHSSSAISSPVTQSDNYRRQSMPTPIIAGMSPIIESEGTPRSAAATIAERRSVPTPTFTQSPGSRFSFQPNYNMGGFANDFLPFSSALPAESQQLLGDTLDPNNPMTSMLMSGSELLPNYNYSTALAQTSNISGGKLGGPQMYSTMDGLNSTLGSMHDDSFFNEQSNEGQGFDVHQSFFEAGLSHSHGGTTSGTPVDDNTGWDLFMNDEVIPTGSQ